MSVALQSGRHTLLLKCAAEGCWTPHAATWIEAEITESDVQSLVGKIMVGFVWGIADRTLAVGDRIAVETHVKKTKSGKDLCLTRVVV